MTVPSRHPRRAPGRWLWLALFAALLAGVAAAVRADGQPPPRQVVFDIRSDFADGDAPWLRHYLRRSLETIDGFFHNELTEYPRRIRVTLREEASMRGLKGSANRQRGEIQVTTNLWQNDRYRRWIVLHELINLLVAHYGSPGGYPSDWWSNGSSPFPLFVAGVALSTMGYAEDAAWLRRSHRGQPDHELYWVLHERFGMALFQRFFQRLKRDGIDLTRIGAPWPTPDERRSLYTVGYLSLAAGTNLAATARRWGVGREPADWRRRHPEIGFEPYAISEGEVDRFMAEHRVLFDADPVDRQRRARFIDGNLPSLLD